jgi:hypothetical protein
MSISMVSWRLGEFLYAVANLAAISLQKGAMMQGHLAQLRWLLFFG